MRRVSRSGDGFASVPGVAQPSLRVPVPARMRLATRSRWLGALRPRTALAAGILTGLLLGANAVHADAAAAGTTALPRPVHVRLIYTGGPFSPVSVVWTTTARIARIVNGTKIDAGVGVSGPPSSTVSSYGRCYQGFASIYEVKHLAIGSRYAVTIAIGHGMSERRFTRRITLRRASLGGTTRQLRCGA